MLRLPPFQYLSPQNLEEAVRMRAEHGPEAMYVAGGTDLYPNMKRRQFEPKVLVGLRRLVGPRGERVIRAAELYNDDGIQYLTKAPDEILSEIMLPPAGGMKSVYLKLRRRGAFDFPILGVAAAVRLAADVTVTYAKIV